MRLRRPLASAATVAVVLAALAGTVPGVASAHPLGNFTINHYAGIRVSPTSVAIDLVLDEAEIPTFQERQRLDTNGDGVVSAAEIEAERQAACPRLSGAIDLALDGTRLSPSVDAAGISFLPGAGGLFTMRTVCELAVALPRSVVASDRLTFEDRSFEARIGWREIIVAGDGVTIRPGSGETALTGPSVSDRLTHYPSNLLSQPLDIRAVGVELAPGGARLPPFAAPDAAPLSRSVAAGTAAAPSGKTVTGLLAGAIPGGVGNDLSGLLSDRDVTLPILILSLFVAAGLGAAHAVSPGHGKTLMAAYLVGSRGTARHAIGLGLVVTFSHTLGVVGLAAVTVLAGSIIAPDRLYPLLGALSGGMVVAMGAWLVFLRLREMRSAEPRSGREDGHVRERDQPRHHHGADQAASLAHSEPHDHPHSHGGRSHVHLPPTSTDLTWRRLFALGLAGGLVPSASALLLLLGALATGRPAYGLLLVVAFGGGMAVVLAGVGLAMVHGTRLVARLAGGRQLRFTRAARLVPLATAIAVLAAGVVLTSENLHAVF